MIIATVGRPEYTMYNIDALYRVYSEDDWLNDPTVKQIIKDIDNDEVISPYCIQSTVFGQITMDRVSGGAKALILMLKKPELEIWAQLCGDNCCDWIIKISEMHDVKLRFSNTMRFREDAVFDMLITNDNTMVHSSQEYLLKVTYMLLDSIEYD